MIGRRALMGGVIGAGAAGGLGAPRHDQHYEPPDAQPVPGARAVVRAQKVIVIGANGGIFVYDGTPLHGSLIASIATPVVTNDGHGNAVLPGIVSYLPGVSAFAVQILGEQIVFNTAPSESGPWTSLGTIQDTLWNEPSGSQINLDIAGGTQLTIEQAQIFFGVLANMTAAATIAGGLTVTGGETADSLTVNGNAANTTITAIANALANGGHALLQLTTSAGGSATDRALGIQASGDTGERIRLDTLPQLLMGPGNATPDCTFARAGPTEWFSDGIAARVGGAAEVWNAVGAAGNAAFANGWVNAAAGPNLQYRKVAAPYNSIEWVGRIVAPAGVALNQAVTGSPAGAYKPANTQEILGWDSTVNTIAIFHIGTGGALTFVNSLAPVGVGDTIVLIPALPGLDA